MALLLCFAFLIRLGNKVMDGEQEPKSENFSVAQLLGSVHPEQSHSLIRYCMLGASGVLSREILVIPKRLVIPSVQACHHSLTPSLTLLLSSNQHYPTGRFNRSQCDNKSYLLLAIPDSLSLSISIVRCYYEVDIYFI